MTLRLYGFKSRPGYKEKGSEKGLFFIPKMKCYLYILESVKNGMFYIGISENPDKRLNEHNSASSKFTKGKGPWKRIFLLEFPDKTSAMSRERKLKNLKSRVKLLAWMESMKGSSPEKP